MLFFTLFTHPFLLSFYSSSILLFSWFFYSFLPFHALVFSSFYPSFLSFLVHPFLFFFVSFLHSVHVACLFSFFLSLSFCPVSERQDRKTDFVSFFFFMSFCPLCLHLSFFLSLPLFSCFSFFPARVINICCQWQNELRRVRSLENLIFKC